MNVFTIKDLENLSGIKAHTIRIWEQRYGFLRPNRTETNIRYYCDQELKTLLNVSLLNKHGYKISHIDKMSREQRADRLMSLSCHKACQERIVNELIAHMIDLDVARFEEAVDRYIRAKGIDHAILDVLFPFLERIGILWQASHIQAVQEHLTTGIIRRKLLVGIENLPAPDRSDHTDRSGHSTPGSPKTALLFLPEGEHHELGLLYVQYLLKARGIPVLYLGADVPLPDVEYACKIKEPAWLYTHITCMAGGCHLEKFLAQLAQRLPDTPLIVSGRLAQAFPVKRTPTIHFKRSLSEVMEFVAAL